MVRAKFTCQGKVDNPINKSVDVYFHPVTTNPPSEENLKFWNATPSGVLQMNITNLEAAAHFEVGQDYYLDFTRVN